MREIITFSATKEDVEVLNRAIQESGMNRSLLIRNAIRSYLKIRQLEKLREKGVPLARQMNIYTDDDVFTQVS